MRRQQKVITVAERDERGRFLPGNPGGPGNPMAARVAEYRRAAMDAVGVDEVRGVFRMLCDKALAGDVVAAKVLLDRLFGRATVFEEDTGEVRFEVVCIPLHGPDDPLGDELPADDWVDADD